mmetsp:Transcript_8947/g.37885  ORF Transcript_8947/g.37885 Transcript_8947/m.37885 type:complete len:469 (+) Transcript_8947:245-1651(+)
MRLHGHLRLGGVAQRVGAHDGRDGVAEQLDVVDGVAGHHGLVQVRVEGHLLHVLVRAHLHESFARGVGAVENLLQDVENLVGGPVLAVPLVEVRAEVGFVDGQSAVLRLLHHRFRGHATGLSGEVDALAGALSDVPRGVADESHATLHAPGSGVLGNRVRLDADDLAARALLLGALAHRRLVRLDRRLVHDRAGAHRDVVVLGEDPAVKVGRDVVADVHLRQILVVLHLLVGDLDALLERDGVVVLAGVDVLRDARVRAVGADHDVHFHRLRLANLSVGFVVVVVDGDRAVPDAGVLELHEQPVHKVGAEALRALAQEVIHHLAAAHADVLLVVQSLADVHRAVGRGDHLHLRNLAVDDLLGEVKLANHAQGDGTAAGLAVVHLALDQERLAAALRERLRGARARGAAADDGDAELAAQGRARRDDVGVHDRRRANVARANLLAVEVRGLQGAGGRSHGHGGGHLTDW